MRGLSAGKAEAIGEGITDVNNKSLLCDHGGFTYLPTITWESEPNPALVMVSEEEWATVTDMFTVDVEIRVDRENLATGPELTVSPAPCHLCVASRQEAEREDRLRYTAARVFVRRILPEAGFQGNNSHDPEYCDSPGKHRVLRFDKFNFFSFFAVFGSKMLANDIVRRSSRRVKVRGEREFMVDSDMMLRDFKVKVVWSVSVMVSLYKEETRLWKEK